MTKQAIPTFVLHWNRPDECLRTINSLLTQSLSLDIRVIDNASDAASFEALKQGLPPQVKVVKMSENLGWGGAFNVALRNWMDQEESELCFISAHDALPGEGSLAMLVDSMQNDPKIGIACPEYGQGELPKFSKLQYVRLIPVAPRPAGTAEPVELPYGTLLLFRRECLREIGLFDERYFAYGDEHEIGLRARRHGWKVVLVWGAVVLNPGTWTLSATRSYLFSRNSLLIVRTYVGRWAAALRFLLMIPNTVRMWLKPPDKNFAFSVRARMVGMRDFLTGRFGPPPVGL